MYCTKCGKEIEGNAVLCDDCLNAELVFEEENSQSVQSAPVEEPKEGDRMLGFKKALLSTILGGVSFLFADLSFSLLKVIAACGVFCGLSVALAIPSLVLGIQSVKVFIKAREENKVKPIATLVCGLVGIVNSAIALTMFPACIACMAVLQTA